jgi:hypothetical protein
MYFRLRKRKKPHFRCDYDGEKILTTALHYSVSAGPPKSRHVVDLEPSSSRGKDVHHIHLNLRNKPPRK